MKKSAIPRIIFNDDSDSLRYIPKPHTERQITRAIDYLKDSHVDWLCWCVAEQYAYSYVSNHVESFFERLKLADGQEGFGVKPQTDVRFTLHLQGIDYLPILIDSCHKQSMKFIPSFRMNDTHCKSDPTGVYTCEFWRQQQQHRLWEVPDAKSYYNAALDYSYPEVRNNYLTMITEILERYDVDGVEIDFCRNPYTFQPSVAWKKRKILTAFLEEIQELVKQNARKKKKNLTLIMRVPFCQEKLTRAGMDVKNWIKNQLFDVLVMSHLANNYDLELEPWLSLCDKHDILFYASIEAGPKSNAAHNHVVPETVDQIVKRQRAAAQNILAQGAPGAYMFNYPCLRNEHTRTPEQLQQMTEILSQLSSLKTLKHLPKQYTFWQNLPLYAESHRPPQYYQTIPFTIHDKAVTRDDTQTRLTFRQIAEKNPHSAEQYTQNPLVPKNWIKYLLNGQELPPECITITKQPAGKIPSGFTLKAHQLVELTPPPSFMNNGANTLAFHIPRFPDKRDPYIYIYELIVDTLPQPR